MNRKRICAIVLSLVLTVLGLYFHQNLSVRAESLVSEFDLGYEQGFKDGCNQGKTEPMDHPGTIHYVDREVITEVEVLADIELREFTSIRELEDWLAEDDTDQYIHLVTGENGVAEQSDKYDCDDYAFQLQRRAVKNGFLISVIIIEEQGAPHMINLAGINNDIYYIEPQTDEVWFYCYRD